MGDLKQILVTGAAGFLGRHFVAEARRQCVHVVAIVRSSKQIPEAWHRDPGIEPVAIDLGIRGSETQLKNLIGNADAVIHAAGVFTGNDEDQRRNTISATDRLLRVMCDVDTRGKLRARFVLVSSLSVYGYATLPDNALLDERTPVESDPHDRDAYCRAKLEQERLAIEAAQKGGLEVRLMRVGTIYGNGRTWSARLGVKIGKWVLCPSGRSLVPAIHVENCARVLLKSARLPVAMDDVPIIEGGGRLDIVNIVDQNSPSQREWLHSIESLRVIFLPWGIISRFGSLISNVRNLMPVIGDRIPVALREQALAARYKPLRYSCARAEDRLDFERGPGFIEAMSVSAIEEVRGISNFERS